MHLFLVASLIYFIHDALLIWLACWAIGVHSFEGQRCGTPSVPDTNHGGSLASPPEVGMDAARLEGRGRPQHATKNERPTRLHGKKRLDVSSCITKSKQLTRGYPIFVAEDQAC